jgi:hypothetical protein
MLISLDGTIETLGGELSMIAGGDSVSIVAFDNPETNGLVNVIEEVLIPEAVAAELESRLTAIEEEAMVEETVVEVTAVEATAHC